MLFQQSPLRRGGVEENSYDDERYRDYSNDWSYWQTRVHDNINPTIIQRMVNGNFICNPSCLSRRLLHDSRLSGIPKGYGGSHTGLIPDHAGRVSFAG